MSNHQYGNNAYGGNSHPGYNNYATLSDQEQGNGSYAMGPIQPGGGARSANDLLNECREVENFIRGIGTKRTGILRTTQTAIINASTGDEESNARRQLDAVEQQILEDFRAVRDEVRRIKQTPGSGDRIVQTRIGLISRNLAEEKNAYDAAQKKYQDALLEQAQRRYDHAHPGVPPEKAKADVQAIVEGTQYAYQATYDQERTTRARDARSAVLARSEAIKKIARDMAEISELSNEVAQLVAQQEPAIEQINQGADTVVDNVDNANKQIDSAIVSARNARKWKWYLLLVIILIIAIVVGVAVGVTEANRGGK